MTVSHSIRLTLAVKNGEISLKSARRLRMRAPKGENKLEKAPGSHLTGCWIDVYGKKERPLYRRHVGPIISNDVEIPSGNAEAPLKRVEAKSLERLIHLVIPDIEDGQEAVLYEQKMTGKKKRKPKKIELIRIDLAGIDDDDSKPQNRR